MPDEIVIRFSVKDDGSPVIERVNQKIKQTQKETTALAPGLEKARREMTDFVSENAGLIAVATGAALALKKLYETAREGAEIEYTAIKFERLSNSIGTTSDALLGKLREATRGTISDMEAMGLASDLLSLGLAKNADEAVRLARVQSGLSMDMNQLVLTLTNQTTMRFDQLGVSVDGFKEKVAALEAQGYSTNDAFKEAFLQQAEAQLEKVGNAADENIGAFKRLEAQMKNNIDSAKVLSSEALAPVIRYLADSTEKINRNKDILKQLNEELYKEYSAHKVLTPEMKALIASYERSQAAADAFTSSLVDQGGQAQFTAEQLKEIGKTNKSIVDGAIEITKQNRDYQESQQEILDKIAETRAAGEKLYPWEAEKIDENKKKLEELGIQYFKNRDDFIKATNDKMAMMAIEKIAMMDGVEGYSQAEYQLAKQVLETQDVATAAAFEQQQAMEYLTDAVANGQLSVKDYGKIIDDVMADGVISVQEVIDRMNAIPRDITTNINLNVSQQADAARYTGLAARYRDAPSQGSAGGVHIISPAASPEMFIPGQSGSFVPNADKNLIDYKKMARAFRDALNQAGG